MVLELLACLMRAQALVAWKLRRSHVWRGLSRENLAVDAGIDRIYVSRWERGLENPTVAIPEQIATVLEIEIIEFFIVPNSDDRLPTPLRGGQRPKR